MKINNLEQLSDKSKNSFIYWDSKAVISSIIKQTPSIKYFIRNSENFINWSSNTNKNGRISSHSGTCTLIFKQEICKSLNSKALSPKYSMKMMFLIILEKLKERCALACI